MSFVEFAMLLAVCEGHHSRYEVCEHADGYLVQMRDLETGDLDDEFATLFRTMPVAFAYAEMSAAFDLVTAAELDGSAEERHHHRSRGARAEIQHAERPPRRHRSQRRQHQGLGARRKRRHPTGLSLTVAQDGLRSGSRARPTLVR